MEAMISLYCRQKHGQKSRCAVCEALWQYARARLDRCPFGEKKTTCRQCRVHCYEPAQREAIRLVMRFAGSRMLFFHPCLALLHLLDGLKTLTDS